MSIETLELFFLLIENFTTKKTVTRPIKKFNHRRNDALSILLYSNTLRYNTDPIDPT